MLNSPKLWFGEDIRRNYSRATFDLALWLYITPNKLGAIYDPRVTHVINVTRVTHVTSLTLKQNSHKNTQRSKTKIHNVRK